MNTASVVLETSGIVQVDHDQFLVGESDADTVDGVLARGTLIGVGRGFLATFTGISYGPARVTMRLFADPPGDPDARCEVAEESVLDAESSIGVRNLDGEPLSGMDQMSAGRYRVRCYARGRDVATRSKYPNPPRTTDSNSGPTVPTIPNRRCSVSHQRINIFHRLQYGWAHQ